MQGLVSIVFVFVVSALFAFLYVLRIHVDYKIHVLEKDDTDQGLPLKYIFQMTIIGLLIWAAHALAIATSKETNQEIISFLMQATDWIVNRLRSYINLPSIIFILLLVSAHFVINLIRRYRTRGVASLRPALKRFLGFLSEISMLLAILLILLVLTVIFSSINKYVALNLPTSLAGIIGDMLLALGFMALVVILFSTAASPFFIRKPLLKKPPPEESSGETTRWPAQRIWREVHGTHIKDAVWYGLIYAFVPCLLYRWAAFLPEYSLESHAIFILVLVVVHFISAAVGGFLDWHEIQQLRTYKYRREQYPEEWQVDRNMWFTRIKVMAIIIPVVIASWIYFLWRMLEILPGA